MPLSSSCACFSPVQSHCNPLRCSSEKCCFVAFALCVHVFFGGSKCRTAQVLGLLPKILFCCCPSLSFVHFTIDVILTWMSRCLAPCFEAEQSSLEQRTLRIHPTNSWVSGTWPLRHSGRSESVSQVKVMKKGAMKLISRDDSVGLQGAFLF
jgi:hypothetical protein